MPSIELEGVSLTFPLYSPAQLKEHAGAAEARDGRLIVSPKGRILGLKALENISLTLKEGDRLAIVGRNGSGKTTLLQVMARILRPDAGRVAVSGRCTNLININLGMQPEASGHRNITLRGLAGEHSRAAIEERRAAIAEFSELGDYLHMPVSAYSAGMAMRLSFAIATSFDPEILLLDEWIGAGDAQFQRKATARMKSFVQRAGILALASHNHQMLADICNMGLWLDRGRLRAFGAFRDVMAQYDADAQAAIERQKAAAG
jgi:ABC-type polysaccharide/polyol phosphate transport system ATPase subunit